jgi:superfamily II DNA or RNA helicase
MWSTGAVRERVASAARPLRRVTVHDVRDLVGTGATERGRRLAAQHRVSRIEAIDDVTINGVVHGDGGDYETCVELEPDGRLVGGDCTCPVQVDCKHVAALVLAAQDLLRDGPPALIASGASPVAPWEQVLRGVLTPAQQDDGCTPLGLLLDLRMPRTTGPGTPTPGAAVRPVVPGRNGWVRTGVSWRSLEYAGYRSHGPLRLQPQQVEALNRLARSRSVSWQYSRPEWIELDTLGQGWIDTLRQCCRAGVRLIADSRTGRKVRLAEQPAAAAFDVVRAEDGALTITPQVSLPDEFDDLAGATSWAMLGTPPYGVVGRHHGDVLLAAFDPPLDADTARVFAHGALRVPPPDASRFLATAAPVLRRRFTVESSDGSVELTAVAPPRLLLEVEHLAGTRIRLAWSFRYVVGEQQVDVPLGADEHLALRDRSREAALVEAAVAVLPRQLVAPATPLAPAGPYRTSGLDGFAVVEFLTGTVGRLEALDDTDVVVTGVPVAYRQAPEAPTVQLALTDTDTDWFGLTVEVAVGGEPVPLADLVTALTLGEEHLVLPSGTWFGVDRPEFVDLRRLLEEARALQDDPRGPLRLSAYQADLWAELEALGVVREQSERWSTLVKGLTGSARESLDAPAGLEAQLRPYQHEGFEWLTFLRRHGLGGVLADDMGLGKTLQALAMILQQRAEGNGEGPWLVVAPTSVLGTWASEAARFAPALDVRVFASTARRIGLPVAEAVAGADVIVTSYAVLRLDAEEFRSVRWAGLLLDEAQAVKNHQSQTYQAVRRLDAGSRFVVTGTPMENNLMELWALLSIAAPGLFPSPKSFTEHYRRPIESGTAPERLETLRRRIRPVLLRRTKQAVAAELPAKQEQVVRVELPPRHRRLYDRGLDRERQRVLGLLDDAPRHRIAIFRALTLLRQLSLHPGLVDAADAGVPNSKVETLMDLLAPVLAEGHRALVFSQFTSFLRFVRERLDADGVPYAYLDGRTTNRERVIEKFRSGQAPVFLVSLKAGGSGLTLTEADYVFLLDPWWNPAVEAQAVDRAHRIGQDKAVNVYRLIAADTIEEKVVQLQERKRELFSSVVDEGALASGTLTAQDIRALVE